jgi:hypothetical protein
MSWGHPKDCVPCSIERPCKHCGRHYDNHANLSEAEIEDAQKQGCIVGVCETRRRWTFGEEASARGVDSKDFGSYEETVFWCVVIPLPDEPCDVDYMKEISS